MSFEHRIVFAVNDKFINWKPYDEIAWLDLEKNKILNYVKLP